MSRWASVFVLLVAFVSIAGATIVTPDFTFSSGGRAASAKFEQSGTNLVVTLTNTSSVDVTANAFLLTAVFFDITPSVILAPVNALLPAGTLIHNATCDPSGAAPAFDCSGVTDVSGEWAYNTFAAPGNGIDATRGISSTGLSLFGPGNLFNTSGNLDGPDSPGGPQFGITSAGDSDATLPSGGNIPYIKNSVVFNLSGLATDGSYTISNAFFLYGTSLTECDGGPCGGAGGGGGNEIPEPGYLLTLAMLGIPLALRYRRCQQAA